MGCRFLSMAKEFENGVNPPKIVSEGQLHILGEQKVFYGKIPWLYGCSGGLYGCSGGLYAARGGYMLFKGLHTV